MLEVIRIMVCMLAFSTGISIIPLLIPIGISALDLISFSAFLISPHLLVKNNVWFIYVLVAFCRTLINFETKGIVL